MDSIQCEQCGLINLSSALACSRCGVSMTFSAGDDLSTPAAEENKGATAFENSRADDYATELSRQNSLAGFHAFGVRSSQSVRRTKSKYLVYSSLALGLAGMPFFWILAGLLIHWAYDRQFGLTELSTAVVLMSILLLGGLAAGILAFRNAMLDPKQYAPRREAIPGIVISGVGLIIFPLAVSLAIPGFLASRRAANEEAAMLKVKRIAAAEQIYMKSVGNGHCGDIEVMPGLTLLDLDTARTESDGYQFYISRLPEGGCEIHGVPRSGYEGDHSFYISTLDNQLRSGLRDGKPAGKSDPLIGRPTKVAQN